MAQIALPQAPKTQNRSEAERAEIARKLTGAVSGEVRFGRHDRMLYATDASMYQVEPIGVVIPDSIQDAVRAVEFCKEHGLPILPRGGGTSLAGQCVNEAVVIDFSPRCTRVLDVDAEGKRCRVEPGIAIDDLNAQLAGVGLFFPPDPATSRHCNIGGAIGNNAAGARSIRYGRTSENLHGVDVCLADGRRVRLDKGAMLRDPVARELTERVVDIVRRNETLIRERFPRTIRRNAGYALDMVLQALDRGGPEEVNLAHLVCGSEGTLAVTLGAELALSPVPKAKGLAVLGFRGVDEAIEAVVPILKTEPSAVELLDDMVVNLARANVEYRRYVEVMPTAGERTDAFLYVEYFSDEGPDEIAEKLAFLKSVYGDTAVHTHTDPQAMANAWKLRKAGEPLLHGVPGNRKPASFVEDNAVPVERLGEFVTRFRDIVTRHGTKAAYWAHASVGVLHVRPLLDVRDEGDRGRMREIAIDVADLAKELGGVMSGEHGDGRVRGPLLERFFGPELMDAFREVKGVFDPENRLNPGNIVAPGPIESITERMRTRPESADIRIPGVETFFDYTDQHGFDGAVEMCNGSGVCRKKSGGTMCPSYMATLDERHSTRGRGNALRLAISGQLDARNGSPLWNDAETINTLDLCLSCKACKSECPSNVDIARLKAEYTAQRYREHGTPLKARILANVRLLNRMGSLTPGIANAMNRTRLGKWGASKLLGVDTRRSIPAFCRPLSKSFPASLRRPGKDEDKPTVVLFGDCFTGYNERDVGLAAKRLLEAFGCEVRYANAGCCARAAISMGTLPHAIAMADRTASKLAQWVEAGADAILFLEPSCLSSVADDWIDLKMQTPIEMRKRIVERSMLVEQFIASRWESLPRTPAFKTPDGEVVLHAHCHQKALWGPGSSADLLKKVAGDRLTVLDTGCCGMAGSFGYDKHRYDLSMKIGELSLFPAIRERRSNGEAFTLVATGTSCRHQVADGPGDVGGHPLHPVEWMASMLKE